MPLNQLAIQIVRLNTRGVSTPVLVTPASFSLRTPFFVGLAAQLALCHRAPIQFQWYRGMPGPFGLITEATARREVRQINLALANHLQDLGVKASIQITAAITRPLFTKDLVIGISTDRHELPAWTAPIRLTTMPLDPASASPEASFLLQSPQTTGAA